MKSIFVGILVIGLSGCMSAPSGKNTAEAIRIVQAQLPEEFNYLMVQRGDSLEVVREKLKLSLMELSRIEAKVRNARGSGDDIIKRLDSSNLIDLW